MTPGHHDTRRWRIFAVVAAAQFLILLDATIVNVALPTIGAWLRLQGSQPRLSDRCLHRRIRRAPLGRQEGKRCHWAAFRLPSGAGALRTSHVAVWHPPRPGVHLPPGRYRASARQSCRRLPCPLSPYCFRNRASQIAVSADLWVDAFFIAVPEPSPPDGIGAGII